MPYLISNIYDVLMVKNKSNCYSCNNIRNPQFVAHKNYSSLLMYSSLLTIAAKLRRKGNQTAQILII